MDKFDVIVSGAGPAGAQAAYRCASSGLRTVLLERKALPRHKCCAGGVLGRASAAAGLDLPSSVAEREITSFTMIWNGQRKSFRFGHEVAAIVKREQLDRYLVNRAEEAGAEIREGTASRRAKEAESEVMVSTDWGELSAKALIIAEGCTSRLASSLFGRYPGRLMAMGMATECCFGADPDDAMELHFVDAPFDPAVPRRTFPLNGWMFPHRGGGNVGVMGQGFTAAELRRGVEGIMKVCGDHHGGTVSSSSISAHPLPLRPRRRLHTRRTVLVGDAAGFVNPITGEGMSYAFASANLASASVADLVHKGSDLSSYVRGCRKEILNVLAAASVIGPTLYWLSDRMNVHAALQQLEGCDGVVDAIAGIASGENEWQLLFRRMLPHLPMGLLLNHRLIRGRSVAPHRADRPPQPT